MIAMLEWTLSNAQQNIEQLQTPTMGVTINKKSTTEPPLKYRKVMKFLALSLSDIVFIMLINVKMPTIVVILSFMSRINLCSAELIITSRPEIHSKMKQCY